MRNRQFFVLVAGGCLLLTWETAAQSRRPPTRIGRETAVARHVENGEEFRLSVRDLVAFGRKLFEANWTEQDGGGRPLTNGTGARLSDAARPLTGLRRFNRISGPDANSCQGCHNAPYGITGGSGDVVTNAFQTAQRFDFVTFAQTDGLESLQSVGERSTPGLFGAGYIEMLARQITSDLQRIRNTIQPGQTKPLVSKGISFGSIARRADGRWDTSCVEGLPGESTAVPARGGQPSLIVQPWNQDGTSVSLREVTNASFNQHHGIQTVERFGTGVDPDGDGIVNELTRADVTAVTIFEATLPVPGRVIPNDAEIETAVRTGERLFAEVGCTACHVASLPLDRNGWIYSEPGPYNPQGNLRRANARTLEVDLTSDMLPSPRLLRSGDPASIVEVPAYTDFKLHDVGAGQKFLTARLWDVANNPPYFHQGSFTTMRQAVMAHAGEALEQREAFARLTERDRDCVIEFLKTLQVLPPGTRDVVVDEHYQRKSWP